MHQMILHEDRIIRSRNYRCGNVLQNSWNKPRAFRVRKCGLGLQMMGIAVL